MPFVERFSWYVFLVFVLGFVFFNQSSFFGAPSKKKSSVYCVEHGLKINPTELHPLITTCPIFKGSSKSSSSATEEDKVVNAHPSEEDEVGQEVDQDGTPNLIEGEGRRDLSFSDLTINAPKLGQRLWLMRDRVRDLRQKHNNHRVWFQKAIVRTNFLILIAALAFLILPNRQETNDSKYLPDRLRPQSSLFGLRNYISKLFNSPTTLPVLLALLVVAISSFSYSAKYSAIFAAERHLRGLESNIDTESALLFYEYDRKNGGFCSEDWEKVDKVVVSWADELVKIEKEFGEKFGGTYTTIQLPDGF